jgi:methylase of polypeptide subunit release factors
MRRVQLLFSSLLVFLSLAESHTTTDAASRYRQARYIRATQGHEAAQPLWKELLKEFHADRTAATWIASSPDTLTRQDRLVECKDRDSQQSFIQLLKASNYSPQAIADCIFGEEETPKKKTALNTCAPLYLSPLAAGAECPPLPTNRLSCWMQLLLLSVCLPLDCWLQHFTRQDLDLCERTGVLFLDDDYVIPYCHVMPVALGNHATSPKLLYVATDSHPRVLNTIHVGTNQDGAVMYLGPDSLALVHHFSSELKPYSQSRILDLGTGSGIQALIAQATTQATHVTCVDVNRRALLLAKLNFEWNRDVTTENDNENLNLDLVLGDLREDQGQRLIVDDEATTTTSLPKSWPDLFAHPTLILSNPPFLPVPDVNTVIKHRHGWFSGGGPSGEDLLQRVIELSSEILSEQGILAIVSEFMNPHLVGSRIQEWWDRGSSDLKVATAAAKGVLFTNQAPIDASMYAERRADTSEEEDIWKQHLEREGITHISPGLLFVRKASNNGILRLEQELVPKTTQGSIWTPTNQEAVQFTRTHSGSVLDE